MAHTLSTTNSIQVETSCISMSVFEEIVGDNISRFSSRSIFFGASWKVEGTDFVTPTLFGYDTFYCYYSSNKNCGKRVFLVVLFNTKAIFVQ